MRVFDFCVLFSASRAMLPGNASGIESSKPPSAWGLNVNFSDWRVQAPSMEAMLVPNESVLVRAENVT